MPPPRRSTRPAAVLRFMSAENLAPADQLRAELESIPEVARAFVEADPLAVHLVCRTSEGPPPEAAARAILARRGHTAADVNVEISYRTSPGPARRARFRTSELESPRIGHARVRVLLEWEARCYEGVAEGESGAAGEVRLAAQATIAALDALIGQRVHLRLVGIKTVQAFDAQFVVTLIRATDAPEQPLVGVSIVTSTQHRSAALAVLNATNALFGNYMATA